jgi:FixJ family two-component response regulator
MYDAETQERFWSKVNVGCEDECWEWTGAYSQKKGKKTYGRFTTSYKHMSPAHRASWELANGEPLGKRFACHRCDNKACVNPKHLYAGDHSSNVQDAVERGGFKRGAQKRDVAGEAHPQAKLTKADVLEIRRRIVAGESHHSIAKAFGITRIAVTEIRTGRKWSSVPINAHDAVARERSKNERAPAKLTKTEVLEIRRLIAAGKGNTEIAKVYGVSHSSVSSIRRGKSWQSLPGPFDQRENR